MIFYNLDNHTNSDGILENALLSRLAALSQEQDKPHLVSLHIAEGLMYKRLKSRPMTRESKAAPF